MHCMKNTLDGTDIDETMTENIDCPGFAIYTVFELAS